MKKFLKRVGSKLTLLQCIMIICVLFMMTTISCSVPNFVVIHITSGIIILMIAFVFVFVAIDKSVDELIERTKKTAILELRTILSEEYESINVMRSGRQDIIEILELYEELCKENGCSLYAKIDENDNICYAIINYEGEVLVEKKSKRYRLFFEYFYVY